MHLGIIMDGNRRWAKAKGVTKFTGHRKGVENLEKVIDLCLNRKIEILTVYALSTENLKREAREVKHLFALLEKYLKQTQRFQEKGIRVRIIGNRKALPASTQKAIAKIEKATHNEKKLIFNIAINYGGRDEIVRAANQLLQKKQAITMENLGKNLDTAELPAPDLIIRTGGDQRLSNFLLWQSSYSSLYFTPIFWPDFEKKEFEKALDFLAAQKQNYGK